MKLLLYGRDFSVWIPRLKALAGAVTYETASTED